MNKVIVTVIIIIILVACSPSQSQEEIDLAVQQTVSAIKPEVTKTVSRITATLELTTTPELTATPEPTRLPLPCLLQPGADEYMDTIVELNVESDLLTEDLYDTTTISEALPVMDLMKQNLEAINNTTLPHRCFVPYHEITFEFRKANLMLFAYALEEDDDEMEYQATIKHLKLSEMEKLSTMMFNDKLEYQLLYQD